MTTRAPGESHGVYVHVPFCRRRCPYCDFAFEVRPADPRFAAGVAEELSARAGELHGPAASLSFGGGTPSALPFEQLGAIVKAVRTACRLTADAEVRLELDPEDVDDAMARALRDVGFSRASLGVQSFDDTVLAWLGRAHDGSRAHAAVAACLAAGLRTGVDLIVGVPGESDDRLARDIEAARALGVGHISAYVLTVEADTPLVQLIARGRREAVDEDAQAAAYERVQALLEDAGYAQYEVSSYARAGEESFHNRLYWQGGGYLGVGPSAHSMRRLGDGSVLRRHTTARLDGWLPAPAAAAHDVESLTPGHAFREAAAFGIRDLAAGIDVAALAARHGGVDERDVLAALARAVADGDVERRGARFHLTRRGARFADCVARAVLAVTTRRE